RDVAGGPAPAPGSRRRSVQRGVADAPLQHATGPHLSLAGERSQLRELRAVGAAGSPVHRSLVVAARRADPAQDHSGRPPRQRSPRPPRRPAPGGQGPPPARFGSRTGRSLQRAAPSDVQRVAWVLRRRRWSIMSTALVVLFVTAMLTWLWP